MATSSNATGRFTEAAELFENLYQSITLAVGSDHPLAGEVRDSLAAARRAIESDRQL
ncbi:hypothetical protein [Nocardia colli]|uniref:hypothetical protein n=1 Tax=Nocardia colli TaxID=2545717 RepID=UPI00168D09A0|nr:hypothetical protein [Nocardia colli]